MLRKIPMMHIRMGRILSVSLAPESEAGASFFAGDVDGACERILARIRARAGGYVCQANVHVVVTAWHDSSLQSALQKAWMVCPDGAPVAWMLRKTGDCEATRIAGADLMTQLFEVGQRDRLRHFLFGSTPHVLQRLQNSLEARYPSAEIAGRYSPGALSGLPLSPSEVISLIRHSEPDVVWCGLGAPKQELWMHHYADALAPAVLVGVGAAFDFEAGTKRRAPEWMQHAGLEWLHRLGSEPHRLARRYLRTNSEFLARVAVEMVRPRDH